MKPKKQSGAALLVTLTLISILTIIASQLYDFIKKTSVKQGSLQDLQQAQWYARSGEHHGFLLATEMFDKILLDNKSLDTQFPINKGSLAIKLQPMHNCFNLNSLDATIFEKGQKKPNTQRKLAINTLKKIASLSNIDMITAHTLTSRLADWIDQDSTPIDNLGLERAGTNTPLPVNGHLQHISEIKQLGVLDNQQYKSIESYLCARPGDSSIALNPNDLLPINAKLISALTNEKLSETDAKQLLEATPANGYENLESYFSEMNLSNKELTPEIKSAFILERRYYQARIQVLFNLSRIQLNTYFSTDGKTTLPLSRYYGVMP